MTGFEDSGLGSAVVGEPVGSDRSPGPEPELPLHLGHRERLRDRFRNAGAAALADYELLELVLFRAIPRRDVKDLSKKLLKRFGSFAEVLTAPRNLLKEFPGVGDAVVDEFKIVEAASQQLVKGAIKPRTLLASWGAVTDYCRAAMAFAPKEEFRILFLDKRNVMILDEVQGTGTVDHTPVYPREVVKRALELGATALILVHNHPSGDPTPSQEDIAMTRQVVALAKPMGVEVHDHIIVGRNGHTSLRRQRLM